MDLQVISIGCQTGPKSPVIFQILIYVDYVVCNMPNPLDILLSWVMSEEIKRRTSFNLFRLSSRR